MLLIFDFDGTIGDTASLIVNTMQQTLRQLHLPERTAEQCRSTIGLPLAECFTAILPVTPEEAKRCAEVYTEIFLRDSEEAGVQAFPHVVDTIRQLHRQGHTLTIATSRQRPSLEKFLARLDILRYFSYIVTVNDVEHAKPAPDMVLKTLSHFHTAPTEAVVIGDAPYDILMGNAAGTRTIAATYGNGTAEELRHARPSAMIGDFAELTALL